MSMKKCLAICGVIILVASVFGTAIGTGFSFEDESLSGVSVAEEDAIEIEDWHDLDAVRDDLDGDYVLMNDLDENATGYDELVDTEDGWEPIEGLTGTFDGAEHEISNLYIERLNTNYIGLFGYIDDGGEVRNIGVVDASVSGDIAVGGLVGFNEGIVEESYATGNVSGDNWVGGLVGVNFGTVKNSHYNIDEVLINGDHHVTTGGLFDEQYQDWIEDKNLDIADYSDTLIPSNDHHEIDSLDGVRDLLGFSSSEEYKFRLVSDIDLSGAPGLYIPYLAAEFDGQNHTFYDLHIDMSFAAQVGMFGLVTSSGEVHNIGVVDANVSGYSLVGGLVGHNLDGTVENSYATGSVSGGSRVGGLVGRNYYGTVKNSYATREVSGEEYLGGLIGFNYYGTVENSYATGSLSGEEYLGGLIGFNYYGTVENSYATGSLSGEEYLGGLVGLNYYGTVKNSYATGNVSGYRRLGGLVGYNRFGNVKNTYATGNLSGDRRVGGLVGLNYGTVKNSYATGSVNGEEYVGGLMGLNYYGTVKNSYATGTVSGYGRVGGLVGLNRDTVENSYATGDVSGDIRVGGLVGFNSDTVSNSFWDIETSGMDKSDGGTGLTTAEMVRKETFTDADWNFEEDWDIIEEEIYPFLQWQEEDTYPYATLPYFEVEIVDYDEEVEEGEDVTVEYTVTNTGGVEDTQDIEFYVDDDLIDIEEDVSLEGGEVHEGEFTWETEDGDAGDHELEVSSEDDSEVVTVTVEEEEDMIDRIREIPGFTSTILLLASVIAVAIYHKKEK